VPYIGAADVQADGFDGSGVSVAVLDSGVDYYHAALGGSGNPADYAADDPTIIDSFEIGNSYSLGEDLVPNMWEHIRRFMEANGPHLPTPDEPLANREPVQSWWQAMGDVGWFGPNYFKWWRDLPGVTAIGHLISPVAIPMYLLRGTGNYLSRKTAKRYDWPEEVKTAVGPRRLPKKPA
jgi:hypothetical protein